MISLMWEEYLWVCCTGSGCTGDKEHAPRTNEGSSGERYPTAVPQHWNAYKPPLSSTFSKYLLKGSNCRQRDAAWWLSVNAYTH